MGASTTVPMYALMFIEDSGPVSAAKNFCMVVQAARRALMRCLYEICGHTRGEGQPGEGRDPAEMWDQGGGDWRRELGGRNQLPLRGRELVSREA